MSDYSSDRMKANHTLINSGWPGRLITRVYEIDSTIRGIETGRQALRRVIEECVNLWRTR